MKPYDPMRILVVVAHPHDFTHMSGTCGKHAGRGDRVTVVSVTGGATTHNEPLEQELRKPKEQQDRAIVNETVQQYATRKRTELENACRIFGITDVRVLPFADQFLRPSDELDRAIVQIILAVRPHILLTHMPHTIASRGRIHQGANDHVEAGAAVERACQLAATPDPDSNVKPHRIVKTFYMGVEWPGEWDLVIDVTEQAARRVEAEKMFSSQGYDIESFAIKRLDVGAGVAGWHAGFGYGEAFVSARCQFDEYLTFSEAELHYAQRPSLEHIEAVGTRVQDMLDR